MFLTREEIEAKAEVIRNAATWDDDMIDILDELGTECDIDIADYETCGEAAEAIEKALGVDLGI